MGLFIAVTFAWSWLLWLPGVLATAGLIDLPAALLGALGAIAVFGPSVAAFGLTFRREGKPGVARLWQRGWDWRFGKLWWAPLLLLMPALTLLTVGLMMLAGEPLRSEHAVPLAMVVPVFLLIYLLNALPEEYGWRGFALDRLQARWNALVSSILLGALWGLWHLPLHFIQGSVQQVIPVWQYMSQTVVLAVFYTWIYNNTGRSVLAVALFHAMGNISAAVLPYWVSDVGRLVHFGLLAAVAAVIVAIWGPAKLARRHR
jgi:uncharacterized protein